jgi:hypothetical protein
MALNAPSLKAQRFLQFLISKGTHAPRRRGIWRNLAFHYHDGHAKQIRFVTWVDLESNKRHNDEQQLKALLLLPLFGGLFLVELGASLCMHWTEYIKTKLEEQQPRMYSVCNCWGAFPLSSCSPERCWNGNGCVVVTLKGFPMAMFFNLQSIHGNNFDVAAHLLLLYVTPTQ